MSTTLATLSVERFVIFFKEEGLRHPVLATGVRQGKSTPASPRC